MSASGRLLRRLRPDRLYLKTIVPALVVVALMEATWRWLEIRDPDVHAPGFLLLNIILVWFGVVRALRNQPYARPGYRAWLATTPWTANAPLPFGPVALDWSDAVILAAIFAVGWLIPDHDSSGMPALFLFAYGLALTPTIRKAANHVPAHAALFGLGLMARLWTQPLAAALTGVVVYGIVHDGLRRTLRRFPAPGDERTTADDANFNPAAAPCGWPHDRLLRDPVGLADGERILPRTPAELAAFNVETTTVRQGVKTLDAMAWSLQLGWWVSSVGPILFSGDRFHLALFAAVPIFAAIIGLIRLMIYTSGYQPPISGWGRIRTSRWIIPEHDVVYLGPMLTMAVAAAMLVMGAREEIAMEILGPTALSATLFIALAAPPSLRRWRLVGKHRIVPGPAAAEGAAD